MAREIAAKVKAMDFEVGYHPEILGEYAEQQQSRNRLLGVAALSIVGIFFIFSLLICRPSIYSARTHSLGLRLTIQELLIVGAIVEIYDKNPF